MAQSRAHADRENVTESLRGHGFSDSEIETLFVAEAEFARRDAAKRKANRQKVSAPALDFGDWSA